MEKNIKIYGNNLTLNEKRDKILRTISNNNTKLINEINFDIMNTVVPYTYLECFNKYITENNIFIDKFHFVSDKSDVYNYDNISRINDHHNLTIKSVIFNINTKHFDTKDIAYAFSGYLNSLTTYIYTISDFIKLQNKFNTAEIDDIVNFIDTTSKIFDIKNINYQFLDEDKKTYFALFTDYLVRNVPRHGHKLIGKSCIELDVKEDINDIYKIVSVMLHMAKSNDIVAIDKYINMNSKISSLENIEVCDSLKAFDTALINYIINNFIKINISTFGFIKLNREKIHITYDLLKLYNHFDTDKKIQIKLQNFQFNDEITLSAMYRKVTVCDFNQMFRFFDVKITQEKVNNNTAFAFTFNKNYAIEIKIACALILFNFDFVSALFKFVASHNNFLSFLDLISYEAVITYDDIILYKKTVN